MNKILGIVLIVVFVILGILIKIGSRISEREYDMYLYKMKKLDSIASEADPQMQAWLDSLILYENRYDSLSLVLEKCNGESQ